MHTIEPKVKATDTTLGLAVEQLAVICKQGICIGLSFSHYEYSSGSVLWSTKFCNIGAKVQMHFFGVYPFKIVRWIDVLI